MEISFSAILSRINNQLMFLNWSKFFVGISFGTGVTISNLKISGHTPSLIEALIRLAIGFARFSENNLSIFAGMSPLTFDLLVSIFCKISLTSDSLNCGISFSQKLGIFISSLFSFSYSWLTAENLSAIFSACSSSVKSLISSTSISSNFYSSKLEIFFSS